MRLCIGLVPATNHLLQAEAEAENSGDGDTEDDDEDVGLVIGIAGITC